LSDSYLFTLDLIIMSQKNLISAEINTEQSAAAVSKIEELSALLTHALTISLTANERNGMLKMGDKTLAFIQKALEYAQQSPSLIPMFLNLAEAQKDYKLAAGLYVIQQKLGALLRAVEDAGMVAGGEAYDAALNFYNSLKGARANVTGTQVI
jgi:hypothetical protein